MVEVLTAADVSVIVSSGVLPTQAVSYTVKRLHLSLGIMVTASHNSADFNGIKIKNSAGGPVGNEVTGEIEKLLLKNRPCKLSFSDSRAKGLLEICDLEQEYMKYVKSYLDMHVLKEGRLNVLVDSMHGAGKGIIERLLKNIRCNITTVHKNKDCSFGGVNPEPIMASLKGTALLMKRKEFDLCLVTDGDGDRIAALDSHGLFVSPQEIISLLLLYLIRHRNMTGAVVKTISGTVLLDRISRKYNLKLYETPIGFKYISSLMQSEDILIGGEEAGGIGFKNYLIERDGILAGVLLLEAVIKQARPLDVLLRDMYAEFGQCCYLRCDLKCYNRDILNEALIRLRRRKLFAGKKIQCIKDYDGVKLGFRDESWILFRFSGTEPLLRIYAEAETLSETKKLISEGKRYLTINTER